MKLEVNGQVRQVDAPDELPLLWTQGSAEERRQDVGRADPSRLDPPAGALGLVARLRSRAGASAARGVHARLQDLGGRGRPVRPSPHSAR
jgi:hypothetical protein